MPSAQGPTVKDVGKGVGGQGTAGAGVKALRYWWVPCLGNGCVCVCVVCVTLCSSAYVQELGAVRENRIS